MEARIKDLAGQLAPRHGHGPPALPCQHRRHGRGLPGHERGVRPKSAILGSNSARLYRLDVRSAQGAITTDKIAAIKAEYVAMGGLRSNTRYGYIAPARA